MTDRKPDHTPPANTEPDLIDPDRKRQLEALFNAAYAEIVDASLDNPQVTAPDGMAILSALVGFLPEYPGPATGPEADATFAAWFLPIVSIARDFMPMWRQCEKSVYKGIRSVLVGCADLGCDDRTVEECAAEVRVWAMENLADLLKPNQPAKPSTRLFLEGYWAARAEKTRRLRHRQRFVAVKDAARIGYDDQGRQFIEPASFVSDGCSVESRPSVPANVSK